MNATRVLIVQNDPADTLPLPGNFSVTVARSVSAAVPLPLSEQDVVLLVDDGTCRESLDVLQQQAPFLPVIVIGMDESLAPSLLRSGAQDFLVKSQFTAPELKRAITYAIERHKIDHETFLPAMLQHLPVGVWIINRRGEIAASNPEARRIWGGARYEHLDTASYKAWWAATGNPMRFEERPGYVAFTTRQPVLNAEVEVEAFDGSRRSVVMSSMPVFSASGQFLGVVVVNLDISEKRAAQEALRRSEASFRSLLEHSSDIVLVLTSSGRVVYQSPPIVRILGYAPETVLGKEIFDLIHPTQAVAFREHMDRQLASDAARTIEVDVRHADGRWRSMEIVTSRYSIDGDVQIIANARDISERKVMAESLAHALRIGSLGQLAATIAHQFNEVLTDIERSCEPDHRSDRVLRPVKRGKAITRDILAFTRPGTPQMAEVRVRDLFDSISANLRDLLPESLRLEMDAPPHLKMNVDKEQLSHALTNVVLNAWEASSGGEPIRVEAKESPGGVLITVNDQGRGIAAEIVDHIFDPLFTTKHNGMGIGLTVVDQILARHGATIDVQSNVGSGTTITIQLPSVSGPPWKRKPKGRSVF